MVVQIALVDRMVGMLQEVGEVDPHSTIPDWVVQYLVVAVRLVVAFHIAGPLPVIQRDGKVRG
jgi:hypothetical protein